MEDLLQSQIHESCKLALPNGLKDLMWDISREVLRNQPADLCGFIADYLSALLVARENLHVAAHICDEICKNICHKELEEELGWLGIDESNAEQARKIIVKYFESGDVKSCNLLLTLLKKTEIEEELLPEVQKAVQRAFLRHQANRTTVFESSSDSEIDDVARSVRHTLNLYRIAESSEHHYHKAATTIQTAYRAYGVRRQKQGKEAAATQKVPNVPPKPSKIRFDQFNETCRRTTSETDNLSQRTQEIYVSQSTNKPYGISTASSVSLAGSHLQLPKYKPYSAHETDILFEMDEQAEKEYTFVDYTVEEAVKKSSEKKVVILTNRTEEIEDITGDVDDDSDSIDEEIVESSSNKDNNQTTCVEQGKYDTDEEKTEIEIEYDGEFNDYDDDKDKQKVSEAENLDECDNADIVEEFLEEHNGDRYIANVKNNEF